MEVGIWKCNEEIVDVLLCAQLMHASEFEIRVGGKIVVNKKYMYIIIIYKYRSINSKNVRQTFLEEHSGEISISVFFLLQMVRLAEAVNQWRI